MDRVPSPKRERGKEAYMRGISWRWAPLLGLIVGMTFSAAGLAHADEGITVTSVGKATTRPTQVEITGTVSGDAELASDAMVKYRDAKRRAVSAIDGLKIATLTVESDGATVTTPIDQNAQMMAMRGMHAG